MGENRAGLDGEELQRRGFLRTMALGGVALSSGGLSGCVGSALQPPPVSSEQAVREATRVAEALVRLDSRLEARRGQVSPHGFGVDDPFSPRALRALTYTGLVLDLPEDVRRSEPLAELNGQLEAELDQTMMDALWVLAHAGQDARERFDHAVRNNPDFVMDYVESLDMGGAEQGLGRGSRLRLRRVATEINSRLRVESVDNLLGDVVSKMARVAETSGSEAAHRRLAVTEATRSMFVAEVSAGVPGDGAPASALLLSPSDAHLMRYSVEHMDRRHQRRRTTSLVMVGIGAFSLGVGIAAVAATGKLGGAAAITIGAVMLLLSLVVGAMTIRARRQLRRRQELEPTTPT